MYTLGHDISVTKTEHSSVLSSYYMVSEVAVGWRKRLSRMAKFHPPESFCFEKPTEWPDWTKRFGRYGVATKLDREEGPFQVSTLVYGLGREAENILSFHLWRCGKQVTVWCFAEFRLILNPEAQHYPRRWKLNWVSKVSTPVQYRRRHNEEQRQNGDHHRERKTETVTVKETTENVDSAAKHHTAKRTNAQQRSVDTG